MGKHVQVRRHRMARTVVPVAATAILTGALAASPLGLGANADPGPGGDGHHHHDGGGDHHGGWDHGGWDHGGWDGEHHEERPGSHDQPAQKPAPAPVAPAAPAPAAPAAPAPAPAEPAPAVQLKKFPYTAPVVETDLAGLTLEKADGAGITPAGSASSREAVGTVVGTGVALAAIGGFAGVLAAGRSRRGATP